MIDAKTSATLDQLLKSALLNENANEAFAGWNAFLRKIKSAGIDPHKFRVAETDGSLSWIMNQQEKQIAELRDTVNELYAKYEKAAAALKKVRGPRPSATIERLQNELRCAQASEREADDRAAKAEEAVTLLRLANATLRADKDAAERASHDLERQMEAITANAALYALLDRLSAAPLPLSHNEATALKLASDGLVSIAWVTMTDDGPLRANDPMVTITNVGIDLVRSGPRGELIRRLWPMEDAPATEPDREPEVIIDPDTDPVPHEPEPATATPGPTAKGDRLTDDQVREIRRLHTADKKLHSKSSLAKVFATSWANVHNAITARKGTRYEFIK